MFILEYHKLFTALQKVGDSLNSVLVSRRIFLTHCFLDFKVVSASWSTPPWCSFQYPLGYINRGRQNCTKMWSRVPSEAHMCGKTHVFFYSLLSCFFHLIHKMSIFWYKTSYIYFQMFIQIVHTHTLHGDQHGMLQTRMIYMSGSALGQWPPCRVPRVRLWAPAFLYHDPS